MNLLAQPHQAHQSEGQEVFNNLESKDKDLLVVIQWLRLTVLFSVQGAWAPSGCEIRSHVSHNRAKNINK